ncbi:MAG: 3-deoxy-manno-octulosonate cytidylyltransferase [Planctomycetota bacterium]|nr:3-deoxy-manno-octulosonate cytidylyltransferase [Planctomycetota bacterium]
MPPPAQPGSPSALRAVAVIPARLASRRLERKMLLCETGRALFLHTAEAVATCEAIGRVVVATDSEEIVAAAAAEGVEALLTDPAHACGTDRVKEALDLLGEEPDVVVNVQGDEPGIAAADLETLVGAFSDSRVEVATLAVPIEDERDARAPDVVKVVLDEAGDALYFSRAAIPDRSHAREGSNAPGPMWRHVGVYAFRPAALARFCALPAGALEAAENLEQLRWLEAGERMRVVEATRAPVGIDTAEDYARFVASVDRQSHRYSCSRAQPRSSGASTVLARIRGTLSPLGRLTGKARFGWSSTSS